MKNELEDYNRKFAQFPEKIKAEIAAIEVRLVVMGRIVTILEKHHYKRKAEPFDSASLNYRPSFFSVRKPRRAEPWQ